MSLTDGAQGLAGVRQAVRRIAVCVLVAIPMLLILALAIGYTINSFDESLRPDTQALLHSPASAYAPEQNIYLALVGFDAPPNKSMLEVGQGRVAAYDQHLDEMLRNPSTAAAEQTKTDPQRLKFKGRIDFCHSQSSSCWDGIPSHGAEIGVLLADNRDLYQRYLELAQLQGYQETARPSYLAPIRFLPAELRALFLVNVSLRLQTGSLAQRRDALADLQNDLRLWRRVLTGDGRFEYKMVAVASLQGDYLLLADMIADPRTDLAAVSPDVQSLVPVFELGDWSIPRAFTAQYRAFSSDWVQTRYMYSGEWKPAPSSGDTPPRFWRSLGRAVESHYFQFNSTENLAAEQMDQLMAVARAAPSQFYALRDLAQNWERDNLTPYSVGGSYDPASYVYEAHGIFGRWLHRHLNMISAPVIFNPVGKVLVANSLAANLPDFSLRAYDGAALQRLVKLGYEIRRRQLGPSSIPAFLQQHPEWATHPVSGRPFLWNAGSSEIAVQTVARQRAGSRFTVHVWRKQ